MSGTTSPTRFVEQLTFGLHSLCAMKPGGPFQLRGFYDDPNTLLNEAADLTGTGHNVWRGVHPLRAVPAKGRGGIDDVAAVHVLVADLDWHHPDAHKEAGLPSEAELRERLDEVPIDFDVVVNSGHGLQVYALLDRPVTADVGARLQERYVDRVLARHGLSNDRSDLASVLRVPGTVNFKSEPVDVVIERFTA